MEDPRLLQNEVRPGESVADVLTRQMRELDAPHNYWEAVHKMAQREAACACTSAQPSIDGPNCWLCEITADLFRL